MTPEQEFYNTIKIIFFILIGIFIGFFSWHPSQNDYVTQYDYQRLNQEYQKCLQENAEIKEDVSQLLLEYYGKPLVWDVFGVTKYKKSLCALKIVLEDDIPIIGTLPC